MRKEDNDDLEVTLEKNAEDEPAWASKPKKKILKKNYLGVITIEKIGLRQYFYDKNSSLNNVNKGIEVLNASDMPDVTTGNFIVVYVTMVMLRLLIFIDYMNLRMVIL